MDTSVSPCHPVSGYGRNLSWEIGFKGRSGAALGRNANERVGRCDMGWAWGRVWGEQPPLEMPTSWDFVDGIELRVNS